MERHGALRREESVSLLSECFELMARHIRSVPVPAYQMVERIARRRIPRDPDDWPTVALALVLEDHIWTHDHDFLGCGVATWTTQTLLAEFEA